MKWTEIGKRAVATVIQSGTAILIGDGLDLIEGETWKLAAVAGIGGLVAFVHRTSTRYLESTSDPWAGELTLPSPEGPAS